LLSWFFEKFESKRGRVLTKSDPERRQSNITPGTILENKLTSEQQANSRRQNQYKPIIKEKTDR